MIRIRQVSSGVEQGNVFGSRTVLGCVFSRGRYGTSTMWSVVVQCKCGDISVVQVNNLIRGGGSSCLGCRDQNKGGNYDLSHGACRGYKPEKLYDIWQHIIQRCENKKSAAYKRYGARGISICDEWRNSYEAFRKWAVENGYESGLSIDRKDNDGNYEPGNCQWLTRSDNARKVYFDNRGLQFSI